eukprot:762521-Hanusia_phi.AAC.29
MNDDEFTPGTKLRVPTLVANKQQHDKRSQVDMLSALLKLLDVHGIARSPKKKLSEELLLTSLERKVVALSYPHVTQSFGGSFISSTRPRQNPTSWLPPFVIPAQRHHPRSLLLSSSSSSSSSLLVLSPPSFPPPPPPPPPPLLRSSSFPFPIFPHQSLSIINSNIFLVGPSLPTSVSMLVHVPYSPCAKSAPPQRVMYAGGPACSSHEDE